MEELLKNQLLQSHEFRNWTKCMLGINITERALVDLINKAWVQYLLEMPEVKPSNIEHFLHCVQRSEIVTFGICRSSIVCNHSMCNKIFRKLNDLVNVSVNSNEQCEDLGDTTHISLIEEDIFKMPNTTIEDQNLSHSGHTDYDKKNYSDLSFDVATLFANGEVNKWSQRSFQECSFLELIEMIQNCKLFSTGSWDVFQKIRYSRHQIVYSQDNKITNNDAHRMIMSMVDVFEGFPDSVRLGCKEVVARLKQINIDFEGSEYLHFVKGCLMMKLSAMEQKCIPLVERHEQIRSDTEKCLQHISTLLLENEDADFEGLIEPHRRLEEEIKKRDVENLHLRMQLLKFEEENEELKSRTNGDISKLRYYEIENRKLREEKYNAERLLRNSRVCNFPTNWNPMSDKDDLKLVELLQSDPEYQAVSKDFIESLRRIPNIFKIERIQNKTLFIQFAAKRNELNMRTPNRTNERVLWHSTRPEWVQGIYSHGFNRRKNSERNVLGDGVYFDVPSWFSDQITYSRPDAFGRKHVFRCLVLTGTYCIGARGMRSPPPLPGYDLNILYDSTTNNPKNPFYFVVFNDTQAYPEHLITYNYCEDF